MANTIGVLDTSLGGIFNGVGDVVVFDNVPDASYAGLKLSTLLNGMSLGNLYNGTVKYTGDAPTTESLKNEQGSVVYSYSEDGTYSFECVVMGLNPAITTKFLKGTAITDASLAGTTWQNSGATHVGFGDAINTLFLPVSWLNREKNMAVTFPRALCVATPVDQDSGIGVKLSFIAQKIPKTANINTFIVSNNATAVYTA